MSMNRDTMVVLVAFVAVLAVTTVPVSGIGTADEHGRMQSAETAAASEGTVTIVSPGPNEKGVYSRGDIVPIELSFENTDTATLTFGDRGGAQNLEINVTVRDTNGSGNATVYLNTFQVGDGYVYGENGEPVRNPLLRNESGSTLDSTAITAFSPIPTMALHSSAQRDRLPSLTTLASTFVADRLASACWSR